MAADGGDSGSAEAVRLAMQGGGSNSTDVKVVVRVRPQTLDMELQPGVQTCVTVEGYNVCTVRSPHETVSLPFNWVAGPATTQSEFFKVVGRPTVENCLSGFNSSIFAYGQTGSGKTHTMIGQLPDQHSSSLPADAGIIPRIFRYLWARMPEVAAGLLANTSSSAGSIHSSTSSLVCTARGSLTADDGSRCAEQPSLKWLVRCSMLEIHKEDVYDLLRPGTGPLNVREDIRKGVYVEGLCERVVEDVSDALAVLHEGTQNRQVAATDMNAASSRSHCIFTCHIESRLEPQAGMVNVRSSRLHLVDLAGSERLKTSWASAAATAAANPGASVSSSWDGGSIGASAAGGSNLRLRETTSINSSLTVLGLVILRLTEQQPHIPYRNSKLTFLLQDSIGGNAKTVIVANISPSEACLQETLSTLGFAARARKIVNKAVINEDNNDDVTLLRQKVKRLHQELALARALAAKATAGLRVSDTSSSVTAKEAAQQAAHEAAAELQELQEQLEHALQLISDLECRNSELEQAREFWLRERNELEQNCLEARQDLEAMKVSLQQALKENKRKHRWLPDVLGKAALQHHQQPCSTPPAPSPVTHAADASSTPGSAGRTPPQQQQGSSTSKQQNSPGWSLSSMFGRKDKSKTAAAAAAASPAADAGAAGELVQESHQTVDHSQQLPQAMQDTCPHQQQEQQHVLQLVSQQLQELTSKLCPDSCQAGQPAHSGSSHACGLGAEADAGASSSQIPDAGSSQLQGGALLQVQELQQYYEGIPEVQCIVSALRTLAAWQAQQTHVQVQQQAAAAEPALSKPQPQPSSKVAPSELHRQLFEEREVTAQLQARIRQLQQELLLAGGPAVAATVPMPSSASVTPAPAKLTSAAARLARLSPGVGVHFSADAACVRVLQVAPTLNIAPTALEAAFAQVQEGRAAGAQDPAAAQDSPCGGAAAAAGEPAVGEQAEHGVLVQVGVTAAADSKAGEQLASHDQQQEQEQQEASAAAAAAAATIADQEAVIADLRAQLSELQERFHITQRERSNFNSKLQSMRSVLAAARCSTPSSLLSSSGLASPQQSFGVLEPVFGSSICEEGEEEEEEEEEGAADELSGLRLTESFSCWHPQPEELSPVRRLQSGSEPSVCTELSLAAVGPSLDEEMSEAEVWRQHHSQIQQQQVEYERQEQLAKAVHAAIKTGALLGYRTFSPTASTAQHSQPPCQRTPGASPCDQHRREQAGRVGGAQDGPLHAEQQQQEQAVAAWIEQQSSEAGSSGSETTRSNGSTRGSSCSGSAAAESEGSDAGDGWPVAASGLHGRSVLPEPADPAEPHSSSSGPSINSPTAAVAAEAAAAAVGGVSTAGGDDGLQCELGQGEASEHWPAWDASAYEEEIRQLSDQLQGYVTANSQLKGLLQQREVELKAQTECLQQQGHELNCCQDFVEELEQRLKAADESAAAAQAEHCNAMWLKGQVEGLRGLNEALQAQLDEMGQELELRAAQVKELQLLLQRYSQQHSDSSGQQPDVDAAPAPVDTAATATQAAETAAAGTDTAVAAVSAVDASTQTADLAGAGDSAGGASAATPSCKSSAQKPQLQLPADDAVPHEPGQYDQGCRTPAGSTALQTASPARTPGSRRGRHRDGPLPGAAFQQAQQPMSPFRQLRVHTHHLRAEPHNAQVATEQRTLLQQQIVAMGLVMQRQQLEQQLDEVRQQLQGLQHEQAGAAGLDAVLSRLGSPAQHDAAHYGSPQQEQQTKLPARLLLLPRVGLQSRLACSGSSSPQAVLPGAGMAGAAAVGDLTPTQQQHTVGALAMVPCTAEPAQSGSVALGADTRAYARTLVEAGGSPGPLVGGGSSPSHASSAVSTPRSTSASDSGDSTELLNELNDLAMGLQQLACASHQASTFKAVSASTLRCSQTLPAGAAGLGSTAVSGAGSPVSWQGHAVGSPGSPAGTGALLQAAAALDADATLKLQADLQVSSAYELAATRGLLHAGAVVQELMSVLTSTKHTGHRTRQAGSACHASAAAAGRVQQLAAAGQPAGSTPHRDQQLQRGAETGQRQRDREQSPPVVRTLFSTRESADFGARQSPDAARAPSVTAAVGAVLQGGGSPAQQQDSVGILRQLQQQQQYIIQVLGSLSAMPQPDTVAGGSPSAAVPLQQLSDAQQQLQVLLHVAGALIQQAHAEQGGSSDSGANARQGALLVPSALGVAPGGRDSADLTGSARQGPGHWAGSAAAAAVCGGGAECTPGSSPITQQHKAAGLQQLQGSSPDQQQQRDSSPDKLRRSQRGRPWPAADADGGQQLVLVAGNSSSSPAKWRSEQHTQLAVASVQPDAAAHAEELVHLRGQVAQLQLQLQGARQQVRVAESLLGSCNSLGGSRARSITPDHAWARQSMDSVSTPAGAAAASRAAIAASTGATVASGSSAGTPASQLLLLNGRNKELQVQCVQREQQVRGLENEVRRLQLELRQQQQQMQQAYLGGGAAAPAGGLTPRGAAATPRHGLAGISISGLAGPSVFSPQRRAVSSPGASGTTPGRSFGGAAAAYGTPPGMHGAAGVASPGLGGGAFSGTQPAFMPTTRFASGSSHGCIPEVQTWLAHPHVTYTAAVGEVRGSISSQDPQQQSGSGCGQAHSSSTSVRASLDEVSCASSSSRGKAKGIRVGCGKPPLHVSSLRQPR